MKMNANQIQLKPEKLQYIKEYLVKTLKPQKIILFGSRAESRAREESDVDLLIILDAPIDRKLHFNISSQLKKEVGLSIQLIFMQKETYEETKEIIGGIANPATKYGVLVYENA
ncbi:MAG: nucleotidyltransferase domain-containing protein [Candidatus Helarchaeota archaeon]|nr:nucleotidyltransferase domain-containing protein [Candidatus Helarchaeota archaeon]